MHCKATAHVMFSRLCTNKLVCKIEMHAKSRMSFHCNEEQVRYVMQSNETYYVFSSLHRESYCVHCTEILRAYSLMHNDRRWMLFFRWTTEWVNYMYCKETAKSWHKKDVSLWCRNCL